LLQTKELSKTQQRYIRYKLRKKIKQFYSVELPLLVDKGYVAPQPLVVASNSGGVAANDCGVASGSHDGTTGAIIKIGPIRDINIISEGESEAHTETEYNSGSVSTERGSPSLVGRGIANPMSERTRGFEMLPSPPS
jgi:hypothetical protein